MPTECSRDLFGSEVVEGRRVVAAFDGGEVTSDAGALLPARPTRDPPGDAVRCLLRRRPGPGADRAHGRDAWWRSACSASRWATRI